MPVSASVFFIVKNSAPFESRRKDGVEIVVIPAQGGIQFCGTQNLRNYANDSAPIGPHKTQMCFVGPDGGELFAK